MRQRHQYLSSSSFGYQSSAAQHERSNNRQRRRPSSVLRSTPAHFEKNAVGMILSLLALLVFCADFTNSADAAAASRASPANPKEYFYFDQYPVIQEYVKENQEGAGLPEFLTLDYPKARIVEFYASWCPHCQHFKPKFIEFSKQMNKVLEETSNNDKFEIHAVSCVPNPTICQSQGVKGYPTLKMYPANSVNGTKVGQGALNPKTILHDLGLNQESYGEEPKERSIAHENDYNDNMKSKEVNNSRNPQQKNNDYFMSRSKQATFEDAHLSLQFALRNAIFVSPGPLPRDRKEALHSFLELLQTTAPSSASFQPLLKALLSDYRTATSKDSELNRILDEHDFSPTSSSSENNNNNNQWSSACTKHGTGYTCGLWQLFHILTIGLVEWNEMALDESQRISTHSAGETIRNFIDHFFQCEECKIHFLHEYDACGHDRCNRLTHDTHGRGRTDWMQLPLWLFETHNGVNARLRKERIELKEENPMTDPQDVLWPSIYMCPKCWLSEGRWDEDIVYSYLRLEYWPEDFNSQKFRNQMVGGASRAFDNVHGYGGDGKDTIEGSDTMWLPTNPLGPSAFVIISLSLIVIWQRKKTFDKIGYHKKRFWSKIPVDP